MANPLFQKLVVLPGLTSPVGPTQAATLTANMAALSDCPPAYLKTITIVSLAFELNGYSGQNYVSPSNMKQLDQDAVSLLGGISLLVNEQNQQIMLLFAAIAWAAAAAKVGSSFTSAYSDVNAILAFAPGLLGIPLERLDQMIALLRYRLAVLGV